MSTRQYIGARYVPKFYDYNGSPEWRVGVAYENLTIVTRNGNSYTSKKPVPSNIGEPEYNTEYWVATGLYNEQVEAYRQLALEIEDKVNELASDGAIGTDNLADNSVTEPKLSESVVINYRNYYVTPEMFGATGDGVADDTDAIQSALNSGYDVYFLNKRYRIILSTYASEYEANVGLMVKSNTNIHMGAKTEIVCDPVESSNYAILLLENVSNVLIDGGTIIGERVNHLGATGESGMGVRLVHCNNITISNLTIKNCWGDGVYIGYVGTPDKNINLFNVTCDNNRRNAVSIINGENIVIDGCNFKNTNGTAPQAGVDIESNYTNQWAKNIKIYNTTFENNKAGIMFNHMGADCGVSVMRGCTFISNEVPIYMNEDWDNPTTGVIDISDIIITGRVRKVFNFTNKLHNTSSVFINNVSVVATGTFSVDTGNEEWDAVIEMRSSGAIPTGRKLGGIIINNLSLDYSKTESPYRFITRTLQDKPIVLDINVIKALHCPVTYTPNSSESEIHIKMDKSNYAEIGENAIMTAATSWMYTNLVFTNTGSRCSAFLYNTVSDYSDHYFTNNTGQQMSVYLNSNANEIFLEDGEVLFVTYNKGLGKFVASKLA